MLGALLLTASSALTPSRLGVSRIAGRRILRAPHLMQPPASSHALVADQYDCFLLTSLRSTMERLPTERSRQ